jgi:hypothetical protein
MDLNHPIYPYRLRIRLDEGSTVPMMQQRVALAAWCQAHLRGPYRVGWSGWDDEPLELCTRLAGDHMLAQLTWA